MMSRVCFLVAVLACLPTVAAAEPVRAFVTRYSYKSGPILFAPNLEYGHVRARAVDEGVSGAGSQTAISLFGISTGGPDFQAQVGIGYRTFDLSDLKISRVVYADFVDATLGVRYFPRAPTLLLAETFCVRATAAASVGISVAVNGDLNFPAEAAVGFHGTVGRVVHGGALELVWRPTPTVLTYRRGSAGDPNAPETSIQIPGWTVFRLSVYFGT